MFAVNYIFPRLHITEIKAEYLFQFIAPDKVALLTLNIFFLLKSTLQRAMIIEGNAILEPGNASLSSLVRYTDEPPHLTKLGTTETPWKKEENM